LRLIAKPSRTGTSPVNALAPTFLSFLAPYGTHTNACPVRGQDYATYSRCPTTTPGKRPDEYLISVIPIGKRTGNPGSVE